MQVKILWPCCGKVTQSDITFDRLVGLQAIGDGYKSPLSCTICLERVREDERRAQETAGIDPEIGEPEPLFTADDLIYTYTREQAIADGVLRDVTETAREAGYLYPTAITAGLWADITNIPPNLQGIESINGRLWDVIHMGGAACRGQIDRDQLDPTTMVYRLVLNRNINGHRRRTFAVKYVVGPHGPTNPEPCITLMLPNED